MNKILTFVIWLALGIFSWGQPLFAQTIPRTEIARGVSDRMQALFSETPSGLQVVKLFSRHDLRIPDGVVRWELPETVAELAPGRQTVSVSAFVDGVREKDIRVTAVLRRVVDTPVLRKSLRRGEIVTAADLRWRKSELSRPVPDLVRDPSQVVGLAVLRQVREGLPMRQRWFGAPVVVDRGQRVQVKLVRGGLSIKTVGVAMSSGRVGDLIQFRNPKSRLRFEAKVTAPGQARIP